MSVYTACLFGILLKNKFLVRLIVDNSSVNPHPAFHLRPGSQRAAVEANDIVSFADLDTPSVFLSHAGAYKPSDHSFIRCFFLFPAACALRGRIPGLCTLRSRIPGLCTLRGRFPGLCTLRSRIRGICIMICIMRIQTAGAFTLRNYILIGCIGGRFSLSSCILDIRRLCSTGVVFTFTVQQC